MLMSEYLVERRKHPVYPEGSQEIYRFSNNYGASVVYAPPGSGLGLYIYTPDEREVAVIRFNGPSTGDWIIVYDTIISDDVLGHIPVGEQLEHLLGQIAELE